MTHGSSTEFKQGKPFPFVFREDYHEEKECLACGETKPIDDFYRNPPGINWDKTTLYDDFYTEKRETLLANNMLNIIIDKRDQFDWDEEKEIKFKESFLQDFCKGFVNDW